MYTVLYNFTFILSTASFKNRIFVIQLLAIYGTIELVYWSVTFLYVWGILYIIVLIFTLSLNPLARPLTQHYLQKRSEHCFELGYIQLSLPNWFNHTCFNSSVATSPSRVATRRIRADLTSSEKNKQKNHNKYCTSFEISTNAESLPQGPLLHQRVHWHATAPVLCSVTMRCAVQRCSNERSLPRALARERREIVGCWSGCQLIFAAHNVTYICKWIISKGIRKFNYYRTLKKWRNLDSRLYVFCIK